MRLTLIALFAIFAFAMAADVGFHGGFLVPVSGDITDAYTTSPYLGITLGIPAAADLEVVGTLRYISFKVQDEYEDQLEAYGDFSAERIPVSVGMRTSYGTELFFEGGLGVAFSHASYETIYGDMSASSEDLMMYCSMGKRWESGFAAEALLETTDFDELCFSGGLGFYL